MNGNLYKNHRPNFHNRKDGMRREDSFERLVRVDKVYQNAFSDLEIIEGTETVMLRDTLVVTLRFKAKGKPVEQPIRLVDPTPEQREAAFRAVKKRAAT